MNHLCTNKLIKRDICHPPLTVKLIKTSVIPKFRDQNLSQEVTEMQRLNINLMYLKLFTWSLSKYYWELSRSQKELAC